jgi:hypothetical protein
MELAVVLVILYVHVALPRAWSRNRRVLRGLVLGVASIVTAIAIFGAVSFRIHIGGQW